MYKVASALWDPATDELESPGIKNLSLSERLLAIPKTLTMEPKYHVHSRIAEFFCAITSPFMALPLVLWFIPPPDISRKDILVSVYPQTLWFQELSLMMGIDDYTEHILEVFGYELPPHARNLSLPLVTHLCLAFTIAAATASTIYHATLYRIFSTIDCACATIMCYLTTVQIWSPFLREWYYENELDKMSPFVEWDLDFDDVLFLFVIGFVMLPLMSLFGYFWERGSAKITIYTMTLTFPFLWAGCSKSESYPALACGVIGLLCFAADRKKILPIHPFWHIFSGLFGWWAIWRSIEIEARVRAIYG